VSSDIDLYEDEDFILSAICGGWGVRLHVTTMKSGKPVIPVESGTLGDLLSMEKLDGLIAGLEQVKGHLQLLSGEDEDNSLAGE
jgi:hypothetical protein